VLTGGPPAEASAPAQAGVTRSAWSRGVERLTRSIERVFDACIGLMILIMAASVCWQVFARYVLAAAPGWSEELARYLMIWVTMIGGAAVLRSGGQMAVTALLDALPGRWATLMLAVRDMAMLVTLGLLIWWGAKLTQIMMVQETASLNVSKAWVYLALPVGAALMLLVLVLTRLAGGTFRAEDVSDDSTQRTS
jgi:TRAP-type C4-dicarboxylate transport system permease small subunit